MKKIMSLILVMLLSVNLLSAGPFVTEAEGEAPMITGMYVAPELASGENAWTQEDWNTIVKQMKEIGVNKIVIQYAVSMYSSTNKAYYYNPGLENVPDDNTGRKNQIPFALKAAKENGVKIWLGLQLYEGGWFSGMSSGFNDLNASGESNFLNESKDYAFKVFDDLWHQFKGEYADTIGGWYLPFEFNNIEVNDSNGSKSRLINNFYKPVTAHIKSVTPDKPTMCSPLIYAPLVGTPSAAELNVWKSLCKDVWAQTQLDIISPQDGCGWESTVKDTLAPWYKAMDEARKEAQPIRDSKGFGKAVAWNNPEAYSMNSIGTMTTKRFTDNMRVIDQYVTEHVSFSLHSFAYLSSGKGAKKENEYFHSAYKYYFENKKLYTPESKLPTPADFKAELVGIALSASLSWKRAETANTLNVAGYEIWRKEAGEGDDTALRLHEVYQPESGDLTILDHQVEPGKSFEYLLYAIDASGNKSETPARATLEVPWYGISLNRDFGDEISKVSMTVSDPVNVKKMGNEAVAASPGNGSFVASKLDSSKPGRFNINLNIGNNSAGFVYIEMKNEPFSGIYLPERIDVIVDGKIVNSLYTFEAYFDTPIGATWIPVDLKSVVDSKDITLSFTLKNNNLEITKIKTFGAKKLNISDEVYKEPVNLVQGQPVYLKTPGVQNFDSSTNLAGNKVTELDFIKGAARTKDFRYKEVNATKVLTRSFGKSPYISWLEDSNRSVWFKVQNAGSYFELCVDLNSPARIRGVETEWLHNRDATVFAPKYIEIYGVSGGVEELISKAMRPAEAMIDFDKTVDPSNTHQIEVKSYKGLVDNNKLYSQVIIKVYPQYPANVHFVKNFIVY